MSDRIKELEKQVEHLLAANKCKHVSETIEKNYQLVERVKELEGKCKDCGAECKYCHEEVRAKIKRMRLLLKRIIDGGMLTVLLSVQIKNELGLEKNEECVICSGTGVSGRGRECWNCGGEGKV